LLGLGVLCTAIPSLGFAIVSKRLPSTVTAATSLLIPLFAGVFAYVFLGEKLSSTIVPGGLFVLAGLVMNLRQNRQSDEGRRREINSAEQQEILKTCHFRLDGRCKRNLILRGFRGFLLSAMSFRWVTIAATIGCFILALVGLPQVERQFFPASDRPELLVDMTHLSCAPLPLAACRSPSSARTWNGSPNTSSAAPFRWKKTRAT
jgi:multidrug efflux pump subunit AcrB